MWTTTIYPRFGDTDILGHINNTVLAAWFEQARNPIFKIFCPSLEINYDTFSLIMAHTDYDFVGEICFRQEVEIRSGVSRIGTKSFTVYQEAWQGGRLCAKGHAVIVHYDFRQKISTPVPEEKRLLLAEHAVQEPS
ncbi:MAG: acyl-CoA thioesterase [Dehalococcoidia bacterium]|nr:acyl-CoA thioesterase [Dehalococcoidia bacterium]